MISRQSSEVLILNKIFHGSKVIYVLYPLLHFDFISKLTWKSSCNVEVTESEGKTKYDLHTFLVGWSEM